MKNKTTHSVLKKSFPFIFTILIIGCNTEYFKDRAADKSRDYIFENYPRMSPQNVNYIKYTYPKFLASPISSTQTVSDINQYYWNYGNNYYTTTEPQFSKSRDFSQVAIAWDLPSPNVTIMVIGTCYDNYWSWEPLKLIIRERDNTNTSKLIDTKTDTSKIPGKSLPETSRSGHLR